MSPFGISKSPTVYHMTSVTALRDDRRVCHRGDSMVTRLESCVLIR